MFSLDYQENGFNTGTLSLKEGFWMKRLTARPVTVSIVPAFAHERKAVEDFIINTYADAYDAKIGVHYPLLMSVRDVDGKILAASGFRYAAQESLFLEQYLSHPIEEIVGAPRAAITEIGNLASLGGGASVFLFAALSAYLHDKRQEYAVITGTNYIEKRLRTMGLRPTRIAAARPELLLQDNESWGRYYETDPHVMAGSVRRGYKRLQNILGAKYTPSAESLSARLHYPEERI